ncbi:hypothetical protein QUB70_07485 [Microcoleus sp. A003_D6]
MGTVREKSARPSQARSSARESFVAGPPIERVGFCAKSAGFRSIELEFVDICSRIAIVK